MKRVWKTMGELATYVNGYAFKPEDWSENGAPIIRIQNLTGNMPELHGYEGRLDEKYRVVAGDILISWSASLGVYEWTQEDGWLNQHIFKVVFDKEQLDKTYFKYAASRAIEKSATLVHGSTMKHLTKGVFDAISVPVYAMENQRRIASILHAMDENIANRKRVLALLDELVKSRFVEMFGDASKNPHNYRMGVMVDLCDAIVDCPHSTPQEYVADRTHPAIRTTEIHNGQIEWSTMRYVSESEYQQRVVRLIPQAGDIVYGREGSWGEAVILPKGYQFCLGQRVMLLRPKVGVCLPEFLWQQIRSPYVYAQAKAKNVGATVGHVNVADIKKFSVLIPPLEEQQNFAAFVHQVDAAKAAGRGEIAALETLRGKMMQEFFG